MTLPQGSYCMFIPGCSYQSEVVSVLPTIWCDPLILLFCQPNYCTIPGNSVEWCLECFFVCLGFFLSPFNNPWCKWTRSSLSELSLTGTGSFVTITVNVIIIIIITPLPQLPLSAFGVLVKSLCTLQQHLRGASPPRTAHRSVDEATRLGANPVAARVADAAERAGQRPMTEVDRAGTV